MKLKYCDNDFYEPSNRGTIELRLRRTLVRLVFFPALTIMVAILFTSCKEKKQTENVAAKKDVYYTCSMHPQVMQDHPGNCPICGTKLIEVPKTSANMSNEIHLSSQQIQLGNILVAVLGPDLWWLRLAFSDDGREIDLPANDDGR